MSITINSASIGKKLIKKFDPDCMDFLSWLNMFEYIADIVYIPNTEKVEFFLNVIDPSVLLIIRLKVAPQNPFNISYEMLLSHFEEFYGLFHGEWAANYRFLFRDQYSDESVLHYIHSLNRILSKACIYLHNEQSLLVRFINGLKDSDTRKALRSWNNLTLDKAITIAAQMEIYDNSSKIYSVLKEE